MKILIATVSFSLNWLRKEMVEGIKNLETGGHVVDWIVLTEQFEDSELYTHTQWSVAKTVYHNLDRAARFALENGYDRMLVIYGDMVPPKNALTLMLECNADIVTGLMPERISKVGKNILNIYYNAPAEQMEEVKRLVRGGKPFKTMLPRHTSCLLVSRKVLKHPFGPSDGPWYDIMRGHGFDVIVDPRVKCSHVDRDGSIMHPIIK